jgi:methylmalonyl-CoA mutase N-terminal domain/subunit
MMMRFHTQTCGSTLTAQQVENNVVRVTLQALSAVLGGTQSLHTNSKDEALALPTEASAHVALRTQQIIAYESGTSETVDPLGGSYFVESLTNAIEEGVWRYLQQVDELGGALAAIETKYFQSEIMKSAYDYQKQIEAGERVVVGVNEFVDEEATQPEILRVDPEIQVRQIQALKELRRDRDEAERVKALERLKTAASTSENLMPFIIDSVEAEATLGEISDVLRTVFGTHREG